MAHLIDKAAVVEEIENLLDKGKHHDTYQCAYRDGNNSALYALKDKLNTLEVKEVDIDKEIERYCKSKEFTDALYTVRLTELIAKHFYELGLNTSNPLTWEDVRLLDILTFKVDMNCDLEEKEHYEEILKRFKAQKGE